MLPRLSLVSIGNRETSMAAEAKRGGEQLRALPAKCWLALKIPAKSCSTYSSTKYISEETSAESPTGWLEATAFSLTMFLWLSLRSSWISLRDV